MIALELLAFFFAAGFVISFLSFILGIAQIGIEALGKEPLKAEEFANPFGAKRLAILNRRRAAADQIEKTTHKGKATDRAARYMTFFGLALATTGVTLELCKI